MTIARKTFLFMVGTWVLAFAAIAWHFRPSETIGYHAARFRDARMMGFASQSPPKEHIYHYLLWRLHGEPSIKDLQVEEKHHYEALEQLGYFEHREFHLQHRRLDDQSRQEMQWMLLTAFDPPSHIWKSEAGTNLSLVRVTATPGDMKVIAPIIAKFDNKEIK